MHASSNEPADLTQAGAAGERMGRVQKIYRIQPDGTAREVAPTTGLTTASSPYALVIYPAFESDCLAREVCIWTEDYYSGYGVFMGESYDRCQGWRFENTVFQNHTWSIWNRVEGGLVSIWDRYADGSYRYTRYAYLSPGCKHPTRFSLIMDAWVFDPVKTCMSLNLQRIWPW